MGLTTSICVLWGCLVLLDFSRGYDYEAEATAAPRDEVAEPRGRHRLQLLFPLLLRISTRLATLVPTAIMGLFGIMVFVIFSKKAFLISLLALFLSMSGKHNAKDDDVHIHKVESYSDDDDEEHIHYHHHSPTKYGEYYHHPPFKYDEYHHHGPPKYEEYQHHAPLKYEEYHYDGGKDWKRYLKKEIPSLPHVPNPIPLHRFDNAVKPSKPLKAFRKRKKEYSRPLLSPEGK